MLNVLVIPEEASKKSFAMNNEETLFVSEAQSYISINRVSYRLLDL
jgi:hypothetical protein